MRMPRVIRSLATWIACFAILMAALAPSISHVAIAANSQGASWMEVCTGDGMQVVKFEGQASDSLPVEHGLHMEDCPFCLNHAVALGLPPSSSKVIPLSDSGLMLPSLFYQSPQPLFIWAAAQSRAPPALS